MNNNSFYSKWRLIFFFSAIGLIFAYIVFTFGKLALITPEKIIPKMEAPLRGSIFDRNNKPLAIQRDFYHLKVTPSDVQDVRFLAEKIAPNIQMTTQEVVNAIQNAPTNFLYLKKEINETDNIRIEADIRLNGLSGISFDTVSRRVYPENNLASQVIGFMGYEGVGLSGIELSQQDTLVPDQKFDGNKSPIGNNVFLTIDANLQYKLEQIANKSIEETQAESFMLVAAGAKTGEILSYISLPAADLNTYPDSNAAERVDRPAVLAYEPGSVFKIFSVASFIDTGAISESDTFYCDGKYFAEGAEDKPVITCLGHHGKVTAREALQYSCNDALAQMSDRIEAQAFLNMIHNFGFGEKTNLEVPSETRGSIKSIDDRLWSNRSKPTMSIGQELSVSALQMVEATTAIANGGIPVQLSLISRITDKDSKVLYEHKPTYLDRVIKESTANYLLSCMETTAKFGTGTKAALGDISIGVKTGTAQMTDAQTGKYSDTDFVSNVTAVFPVEDPEIVLYIVITRAKGETLSGRIVAPVIGEAANTIIDHLGLARANAASLEHSGQISINPSVTPKVENEVPDFTGLSKRALTPLLNNEHILYIIEGDGWVVSQKPEAGSPVLDGMTISLYLE